MIPVPAAIQAPPSMSAQAPAAVMKVVAQLSGLGRVRLGSGIVVAPGIVATNAHVTSRALRIEVQAGGRTWPASVRSLDASRDLALLSVPDLDLPPAPLMEALPAEGAKVAAWGFPRGVGPQQSPGSIALLWSFQSSPLLQAEVDAPPGSSGGGLFDEEGRLVGLTTFILHQHPKAAFAVPAAWIRTLLDAPPSGPAAVGDEAHLLRDFLLRMMAEPGNLPGWLRLTARWTKEAPEDPEAWSAHALALHLDLQTRDFEDPKERIAAASVTERALNQALALDPAPGHLWRALGQMLDLQGRSAEAGAAFEEALKRDGFDAVAWEGLGIARYNERRLEPALEALARAAALAPDNGRVWALRATAEAELKRFAPAQEHFRIAVGLCPPRGSWSLAWGLAALKNGDRAAAQTALEALAQWKAPEEKDLRKAMGLRR